MPVDAISLRESRNAASIQRDEREISVGKAPPEISIILTYASLLAIASVPLLMIASLVGGNPMALGMMVLGMLTTCLMPSFIAVLLTRRSHKSVTVAAAFIGAIVQPNQWMIIGGVFAGMVVATAVMVLPDALPFKARDDRRPIDVGMPFHIWMPITAAVLIASIVGITRFLDPDQMKILQPFALCLFVAAWILAASWVSAIVPDRVSALVGWISKRYSTFDREEG